MTTCPQNSTDPQNGGPTNGHRLKVGDSHIYFRKAGSGPPVVLLHGGAGDSSDWIETMAALSITHTLYAPDLAGYGSSDRNEDGYRLSDFVESTVEFLRTLGVDSAVMVGHSLGGRIGLEIAFLHPRMVSRLVLIDTAGFSKLGRLGSFLGSTAWRLRRLMRHPQPYPRFIKENGAYADWMCLDKLSELKVPTLMVWSRYDPYYPLAGAIKAKQLIPQARLEVFPGYGHAPHRKEQDSFNRILLAFLAQS